MRRGLLLVLASLLAAAVVSSHAPAGAQAIPGTTIVAGGGTPLSNGIFFPGTAVYSDGSFLGEPAAIARGTDIEFVNLDEASVANGHRMVSLKVNKRTGRPLFSSKMLLSPGQSATVVTSHLKPGTYPFFCPVHSGMWGLLKVE